MNRKTTLLLKICILLLTTNVNSFAQISFSKVDKLTTTAQFYGVKVADMNNDGLDDIIAGTWYSWDYSTEDAKIYIYCQDSSARFNRSTEIDYPKIYSGLKSIEIADLDNNGLKDVIIAYSDSIAISYQKTVGSFGGFQSYYCSRMIDRVICTDINNDGLSDIVAINNFDNSVLVVFEQTNGGLEKHVYPNPKNYAFKVAAIGDINNDSLPDMVYQYDYDHLDTNIFININNQGNFITDSLQLTYPKYDEYKTLHDVTIGDYDMDGANDILGLNIFTDSIYIWKNQNMKFESPVKIKTNEYLRSLKFVDLNCDGNKEILVFAQTLISVHEKTDNYTHYVTSEVPNQPSSPTMWYNVFDTGDLNNDGKLDIAIAYLDGIVIMENTSIPTVFNSIDTIIKIDTASYSIDTFQYKTGYTICSDASLNSTNCRVDSFLVTNIYHNVDAFIDTMRIRQGEICGKEYVDTLISEKHYKYMFTLISDSTLFYSKVTNSDDIKLAAKSINIFPNPANNKLNIVLNKAANKRVSKIEILSLSGQSVISKKFGRNMTQVEEIDVAHLKRGYYLLRLYFDDFIFTEKFLKN